MKIPNRFLTATRHLASGAAVAFALSAQAQDTELVAYWPFDDSGDDSVAVDEISGIEAESLGALYATDPERGSVIDFDGNGPLYVEDASFMNGAGANNQFSFVFWQKSSATPNSSTFWLNSLDANREAQAHVPWSNGNIYFDTSGCCDGGTQRINFVPDVDFLDGEWHHFAFIKNGDDKLIYIDGELAFDGVNTNPVSEDMLDLYIGSGDGAGNVVAALVDDFAIFITALAADQVASLAGGAAPIDLIDNTDTDGDGMPDRYEERVGLDPEVNDAALDADGDGASNLEEYENKTNPKDPDTDKDGLKDGVETGTGTFVDANNTGTSPLNPDTDDDRLLDGVETGTGVYVEEEDTGTDPNKQDSDGDNFSDGIEVANGSNPNDAASLPVVATFEVLDDLIGGDLTDPEDDGDEAAGAEDPSWNWASIDSNDEPGFEGGEFSFNVFDNKKDAGGNDKWCCTGASEDAPLQLTVEFALPVSLTHFTITSANDVPERDPLDWKILGSNDGEEFSVIFEREDDLSLWQELVDEFAPPRFTTVKVTLPAPSALYRFIRYEVTRTGNANHQIGELEYFGSIDESDSDGDGMPDAWEEVFGLVVGTNDAAGDGDADGLTNKQEYDKGTVPNKADTDGDGLKDGVETGTGTFVDANNTGTDPLSPDSDKDGLPDGAETGTGTFVSATNTGTDPNKADTDGDTFGDGSEVAAGSNPNDANSKPEGGLLAAWDFEDSGDDSVAVDVVSGIEAVNGGAEYVDDDVRGSVMEFVNGSGASLWVEDASFLNLAATTDQITFVFWQLNLGTPNSSTFWAVSPSSSGGERGAQAHVPWSNNNIYFDTVGCCDGNQRGNFDASEFFNEEWHHYAFVKDGEDKRVYIDGQLEFEIVNPSPLPDDFTELWIGSATGQTNVIEGRLDDFGVYSIALSEEQINEVMENGFGGGGGVPFQIIDVKRVSPTNAEVTWQSREGRSYSIDYSADLQEWIEGTDGFEAGGDTATYEDDTLTPDTRLRYYRVREE